VQAVPAYSLGVLLRSLTILLWLLLQLSYPMKLQLTQCGGVSQKYRRDRKLVIMASNPHEKEKLKSEIRPEAD